MMTPNAIVTKMLPYQDNGNAIDAYTSDPETVALKSDDVSLESKLQALYWLIPLVSHLQHQIAITGAE